MKYKRSQYRILSPLDEWLKQQASKNNRSKNGELNAIIANAMAERMIKEPV